METFDQPTGRRRLDPWYQATTAAERIPHHLEWGDDAAAQAHIVAFGEALDALPRIAPDTIRPQLRQAAMAFERASRSRIRAEDHHARVLRGAIRAMRSRPASSDGAALAMFLDAAVLVVIAAARWHRLRQHDQQIVAARQALVHLQAAYDQAAVAPLAALARRKPPTPTVERFARLVREAVPSHAEQVLDDAAWPALTTALVEAEAAGHRPGSLLQQAADQRTMDDARSPARTLLWRVDRVTRQLPSARARAAQARTASSTRTAQHSEAAPVLAHQPTTAETRSRRR